MPRAIWYASPNPTQITSCKTKSRQPRGKICRLRVTAAILDGGLVAAGHGKTDLFPTEEGPVAGEWDKAEGEIKEQAGGLTDDESMKREGQAQELKGEGEEKMDEAKEKAGDMMQEGRERI